MTFMSRVDVMAQRGYADSSIRSVLAARIKALYRVEFSVHAWSLRMMVDLLEREADQLESGQPTVMVPQMLLTNNIHAWEEYLLFGRGLPLPGLRREGYQYMARSVITGDLPGHLSAGDCGVLRYMSVPTHPQRTSRHVPKQWQRVRQTPRQIQHLQQIVRNRRTQSSCARQAARKVVMNAASINQPIEAPPEPSDETFYQGLRDSRAYLPVQSLIDWIRWEYMLSDKNRTIP